MRLGVDLDGVCADFARPANQWISRRCNVPPRPVTKWEWFEDYPGGKEAFKEFWLWAQSVHLFRRLNVTLGATPVLRRLVEEQKHRVVFLTHRPEWAAEDTKWWLHQWMPFDHELVLVENAEDKALHDCHLFIDDYVPTVARIRVSGKRAVLFKQPWNAHAWFTLPSVSDWFEVEQGLKGVDFS